MGTELVADTGPVGLGEGYLGGGFIWVGMHIGWFAIVPTCISPPLSHYMHYAGAPSPAAWSLPLMGISGSHYCYTKDLLALDTCTATRTPPLWPVCFTWTVRLDSLLPFLFRQPDQQFAHYIYEGLTCGFWIGFDHERVLLRASSNNHPSTRASPGVMDSNIQTELIAAL